MSIRKKLLAELEKEPRTKKYLKDKLGNDKLVGRTLETLSAEGAVRRAGGVWQLAGAPREVRGADEQPVAPSQDGRRRKASPQTREGVAPRGRRVPVRTVRLKEKPPEGIPCRMVKLAAGFGFAAALDGSGDIFIPGRFLAGALPGDEVLVRLEEHPRRAGSREGEVTSVTPLCERLTGTLTEYRGRYFVQPDFCRDMLLFAGSGAEEGLLGRRVAARVEKRGADHDGHRLAVLYAFDDDGSARSAAAAILYENGITQEFPAEVTEAALAMSRRVPITAENRLDLRGECIFTIDSASTKDMDDAVSLRATRDGYLLGVHIADVSSYVTPGSPIDKEAFARGTSVYWADQVAPMLPRVLSDEVCSLNAGADRLAFSCLMELDPTGEVVSSRFEKSVIRSAVKGVYEEINTLFDGTAVPAVSEKYAAVRGSLELMRGLYRRLAERRKKRGSMDIESGEVKLRLDEAGVCVGVEKRTDGEAESMIEEFMILANGCAAKTARLARIPFVYRVHEKVPADRLETLEKVLGSLGVAYRFSEDGPTQPELSELLDKTRGTPLEAAVHTAVLRSMPKAKYDPSPMGHFGLALRDYAHFTSPIRRYPDLAIHRILAMEKNLLKDEKMLRRVTAFAADASRQSSARELVAMQTERDCTDCYLAEYMRPFIGQEFDGIVSAAAPQGIYVRLESGVEGLVRAELLSAEPCELSEGIALVDTVGGRRWAVGDAVRVALTGVSVSRGQVDFALAGASPVR